MIENVRAALPVILPVTLLTVAIVAWQAEEMAKAYETSKGGVVVGFLIAGLIFGWIAVQVYVWMAGRWPDSASTIYLWVALGIAVVANVLALVMRRNYSGTVVVIWIVLNTGWGAAYGWLAPLLLR